MTDVRVICAIGRSGQLGLQGGMPWEGRQERAFIEDVERFFEITRGHVLIAGPKTVASFPDFAHDERTIVTIRSKERPEDVLSRFPGRVVYIGGGPAVWDVYARYVRHWDINTLPYDGEADTWFNPAWLLAGGAVTRR
ncbi:dihydrofolate reductase [Jiella sp. MQZ9-1]|uniref:Dihydrofolate reductase n=1 Tax=Jiella flava TaxID=2816857 RepID=A0A939JT52_9HYPH|nr:dihydrofolate reductase [Jiella flava]MBO0661775.1 dihydrofolate reductase [Jiella flava]MCD2470416.1 dihydrofolate reductase [Jiella flava]